MELIYKALRDAGLHPYSDDLAHERRMVDEPPPPPAKVWKLREAVAAPVQKPVAWRIQLKDGYLYGGNLEEMRARHKRLEALDPDHSLLEPNPIVGQPETLYAAPPPDEARELLVEVVRRYDDYRGKGVMPAPGEYQMVVGAIERIRAYLEKHK